jgi:glycosyltransferase involved in cell wall biosynthesis
LLVPNVEEFGIAAVEAQAAGRPVVAVNHGGVRETVIDGRTGVLVDGEGAVALAEPLREENFGRFDPAAIRAHAQRFSAASFRERFRKVVDGYRDLA